MTKGAVYFVVFAENDYQKLHSVVKIGCAANPKQRLKYLQAGSPFKLAIAGLIETEEYYSLEQKLQKRFVTSRINGEWFTISEMMIKAVRHDFKITNDRFDELVLKKFEEDAKVRHLKEEIIGLKNRLLEKDNVILKLRSDAKEVDPNYKDDSLKCSKAAPKRIMDAEQYRNYKWDTLETLKYAGPGRGKPGAKAKHKNLDGDRSCQATGNKRHKRRAVP